MEIVIQPSYDALCDVACAVVRAELGRKPDLVLGLATGRTPLGVYERLHQSGVSFARVRFFNLDEFYGLEASHPDSFNRFLWDRFLGPVGADPKNVRLLRGDVTNLEAEAEEYEDAIRAAGGIDLQILGVGRNGHIGFNEPGSSLGSRTRPKTLTPEILAHYMKDVDPGARLNSFALTMGVGTIMEARRLLMLASGPEKAEVVRRFAEGPITAEMPASVLQLHPRAVVVIDEAAASGLQRRDYYKWVWENKWRVGQK